MIRLVYDCDNTMGVPNRDVDDGLTILYLAGRKDVDLLGITTTFGNDSVETVYNATRGLLDDWGIIVPLARGGGMNRSSEAAAFLVEQANRYRGELVVLATGALSNIHGAFLIDPHFYDNVRMIVVMGGITEPLVINGVTCNELNFSSDPEATYGVMSSAADMTVITGHLCLNALFGPEEFRLLEERRHIPGFSYILERLYPWRDLMRKVFKIDGFFNWDVLAAAYVTNQELFENNRIRIQSTANDLKTGLLKIAAPSENGYELNVPSSLRNINAFNHIVFKAWDYSVKGLF